MPQIVWWQRHPRLAFFALGAGSVIVSGAAQLFWYDIANGVFHLGVIYDTRPAWLRVVIVGFSWLPVMLLALVVAGRIRRGISYRPLAFVVGGASAYCAAVAALFGGPVVENYRHETVFERVAWIHNDETNVMWPARLTMVDDLMERRLLKGATRDSVERLLGPADQTEYFKDWERVYRLGPERGLIRIDSEWLVVNFGPDGHVDEVRVVRD